MSQSQNLFAEFSPLSRGEWEARIQKELKGKALQELEWAIGAEVKVGPFYQNADNSTLSAALNPGQEQNQWAIGEDFAIQAPQEDNKALLEGLGNGLEAPALHWSTTPEDFQLSQVLREVRADYISTHLRTSGNHSTLLQQFLQLQNENGIATAELQGSINGDFVRFPEESGPLLRELINQLPHFQGIVISIDTKAMEGASAVEVLVESLSQVCENIVRARAAGFSNAEIAPRIVMDLQLSTSYFVELAKIRDWRLLWPLLWEGFELSDPPSAVIHAYLDPQTQVEDQDLNMIRTTTQAMAAVIGGVNRLSLLPADAFSGLTSAFTRRMARNVQHLLRMESYFDRVVDPAAGSYYLEQLTQQLAEHAWRGFQEREAAR